MTVDTTPSTPSRFVNSESGARQSAVSYLELTEDVVGMTPGDAVAFMDPYWSASSADSLSAEMEQELIDIQAKTDDGLVVHIAPIVARAWAEGEGWDVEIWYAQVSILGDQVAVENWVTSTYSLVWEKDMWRIDAIDSNPGPVPTRLANVVPTAAVDLTEQIAGYDDTGMTP